MERGSHSYPMRLYPTPLSFALQSLQRKKKKRKRVASCLNTLVKAVWSSSLANENAKLRAFPRGKKERVLNPFRVLFKEQILFVIGIAGDLTTGKERKEKRGEKSSDICQTSPNKSGGIAQIFP